MDISEKNVLDFVIIETHFGVPEHIIRADTRNECSEDLVFMIKEVAGTLYPREHFEIYLLPPEPGSYVDVIKFVQKNKIGVSVGAIIAVGTVTLDYLNYLDSHEEHIHDTAMALVDDTAKCLELQKNLEEIGKQYEIKNIPKEKISELCANLSLKKKRNNFYSALQGDGMVKNNQTVLLDHKRRTVFSKKIERSDFGKYVEPIDDSRYVRENIEGIIELISPVVKQKKEGKGITWRGTYYGEDIYSNKIPILLNGSDIDFYMQDQDFKNQISTKERKFAIGDNMKLIFDVSGDLRGGVLLNKGIYIKRVISYNEEEIPHKERFTREREEVVSDSQKSLFEGDKSDSMSGSESK